MNKSHRLSHGAKKVTPPSIPSFNHRGSGSSFGSDYSYEKDDSSFSRDPSGASANIQLHRSNFPKVSSNLAKEFVVIAAEILYTTKLKRHCMHETDLTNPVSV